MHHDHEVIVFVGLVKAMQKVIISLEVERKMLDGVHVLLVGGDKLLEGFQEGSGFSDIKKILWFVVQKTKAGIPQEGLYIEPGCGAEMGPDPLGGRLCDEHGLGNGFAVFTFDVGSWWQLVVPGRDDISQDFPEAGVGVVVLGREGFEEALQCAGFGLLDVGDKVLHAGEGVRP